MNLRKLTLTEAGEVYDQHLVFDFPKAEVKPFSRIKKMWEEGVYMAYGLFMEDELWGYAFFVTPGERDFVLLDYFAVCRDKRCRGLGSRFLGLLKEEMKGMWGIILEVENPDYAKSPQELQIMNRRIVFYERNGVAMEKVTSRVFGVEYRIMLLPIQEDLCRDIYTEMEKIYHCLFEDKVYDENVTIRR